jgi:hypothetical protein
MQKISPLICAVLIAFLISALFALPKPAGAAGSEPQLNRDTTINNDIIINGNNVTRFVNQSVVISGNIIIEENATLYLNGASIIFNQTGANYNITLRNPLGGRPQLVALNSNINGTTSIPIYLLGGAATLSNFTTTSVFVASFSSFINVSGRGNDIPRIIAQNSSEVRISNNPYAIPALTVSNSTAVVSNSNVATLTARDNANIDIRQGSTVKTSVILLTHANATVNNSVISGVRVTNSSASITNSTVKGLQSYGDASITIKGCQPPLGIITSVDAYNQTKISISDSEMDSVTLHDASEATMKNLRVIGSQSFISSSGQSKADIEDSEIDYFTAAQNATASITNLINKHLTFLGKSNVSVSRTYVNEWLNTYDNAWMRISNSTIFQGLSTSGSSIASTSNTNMTIAKAWDNSALSISASSVTILSVSGSPNVTVSNSRVKELYLESSSVTGTINGFQNFLTYWSFIRTNRIKPNTGNSSVPDLTLQNMESPTYVNLKFSGSSRVTIANATLEGVFALDNTILKLENSTTRLTYSVAGSSEVYSYWYFAFHVIDSQNASVAGATVKVIDSDGAIVESGTTDADGWFKVNSILEASVINGSGPEKSLVIEVSSGNGFIRRLAAEFTSGNITLELPTTIPWWQQYWYILTIIAILAVMLASVVAFRAFRKKPLTARA